jgi:hypothetical protein
MVTLQMSPYTNATSTSGWITLFKGDKGEGAEPYMNKKEIVKQRK